MNDERLSAAGDVASANECTGMLPALSADEAGDARTARMLDVCPPKRKRRKRCERGAAERRS